MQRFIGTKIIQAEPMSEFEFAASMGKETPQNDNQHGWKVQYPDGYISWSPKKAFMEAYRRTDNMNFGLAIEAMLKGKKVARRGWNGKNMFTVYMSPLNLPPFNTQGTNRKVNDRTAKWIGEDTPLESLGYFAMFTADKKWQPGWLASQTDMLAEDWEILD